MVHSTAINMVEWSTELGGVLEINKTTGLIRYPAAKAGYSKRSASPRGQHGPKFHVMILDELHEWYGRFLWDDLKYAQRSRAQPIRFVITNAGKNINSVCYEQRAKALRVLGGEREDHRFLCHVLRVPQKEAEAELEAVARGEVDDLPVARKCNPMLGTIIKIPALVGDIQDAIETPSELPNLLRLTYGIWASSAEHPLLKMGAWEACEGDVHEAEVVGIPCAAALDLGEVSDPSSFSIVWPQLNDEHKTEYKTLTWTWIARKNALADTNLNAPLYRAWEDDARARLTLTEGSVTDFGVVRADIIELCNRFAVEVLIYDPKQAEKITQEICEGIEDAGGTLVIEGVDGLQRIAMGQTLANYGEPTREFEVCVMDQRIEHDGNPLLAWEANHVSFVRDKDGNKKPVKPGTDHDNRKVDGIQTTVMGIMGAMNYIDMTSAYESDGGGVVLL